MNCYIYIVRVIIMQVIFMIQKAFVCVLHYLLKKCLDVRYLFSENDDIRWIEFCVINSVDINGN